MLRPELAEPPVERPAAAAPDGCGRLRVAIAEDDPFARSAFADLLSEDPGLEVVGVAGDADGALEVIRRTAPQVVLLDVRMPGGGGPAVAAKLAGMELAPRVLAISARDDPEAVVEMLRAGAVGYLVKGCGIDELLAAVRRAARGEGTLSPAVTRGVIDELVEGAGGKRGPRLEREELERLHRAVAGEGVEAVFQPIAELDSLRPAGYEALARFGMEPRHGPRDWFALAGVAGLGVELELTAMEAALEAAGALPPARGGHPAFVALNASPATACDPRLRALLAERPRPPVVVEVTEHAAVEDYGAFRRAFQLLRRTGVSLAVDDAGAGYSSLRHILKLEPDLIKLDLALVRGIDHSHVQRAMATAFVSFAEQTGATVVAEGIESESELATLRGLGVPLGQGYHLGRPLPAAEVAR